MKSAIEHQPECTLHLGDLLHRNHYKPKNYNELTCEYCGCDSHAIESGLRASSITKDLVVHLDRWDNDTERKDDRLIGFNDRPFPLPILELPDGAQNELWIVVGVVHALHDTFENENFVMDIRQGYGPIWSRGVGEIAEELTFDSVMVRFPNA